MMEIEKSKVERLRELHGEILGGMKKTIAQAIEAGGILSEIKEALPHGDFTSWVEGNTGFDIRTAQRYMKTFARREEIESDTVSHLTEAYRLLEDKRIPPEDVLSELFAKKAIAFKRAQEAAQEDLEYEVKIGEYIEARGRLDELLDKIDPLIESKDSLDHLEWFYTVLDLSRAFSSVFDVLIPGYREEREKWETMDAEEQAEASLAWFKEYREGRF